MRPLLGSCPVLFVEVEHWYFSAGALIPPNVRQTLLSRSVPVNTPPYNLILWQLSENRETGIWRPCKISSHTCKFFIHSQSIKALEWNFYSAAFHFLNYFSSVFWKVPGSIFFFLLLQFLQCGLLLLCSKKLLQIPENILVLLAMTWKNFPLSRVFNYYS